MAFFHPRLSEPQQIRRNTKSQPRMLNSVSNFRHLLHLNMFHGFLLAASSGILQISEQDPDFPERQLSARNKWSLGSVRQGPRITTSSMPEGRITVLLKSRLYY